MQKIKEGNILNILKIIKDYYPLIGFPNDGWIVVKSKKKNKKKKKKVENTTNTNTTIYTNRKHRDWEPVADPIDRLTSCVFR